jgi:hypothetical protein
LLPYRRGGRRKWAEAEEKLKTARRVQRTRSREMGNKASLKSETTNILKQEFEGNPTAYLLKTSQNSNSKIRR